MFSGNAVSNALCSCGMSGSLCIRPSTINSQIFPFQLEKKISYNYLSQSRFRVNESTSQESTQSNRWTEIIYSQLVFFIFVLLAGFPENELGENWVLSTYAGVVWMVIVYVCSSNSSASLARMNNLESNEINDTFSLLMNERMSAKRVCFTSTIHPFSHGLYIYATECV